jgi:hypothetical protein
MSINDPLDRPVTLRELVDTYNALKVEKGYAPTFKTTLSRLVDDLGQTDYIKVRFGTGLGRYTYRVANQSQRRVQVGDLVTVPPSGMSDQPQVVVVTHVNVPTPTTIRPQSVKQAVAISPRDREVLEAAGAVPVYGA